MYQARKTRRNQPVSFLDIAREVYTDDRMSYMADYPVHVEFVDQGGSGTTDGAIMLRPAWPRMVRDSDKPSYAWCNVNLMSSNIALEFDGAAQEALDVWKRDCRINMKPARVWAGPNRPTYG